MKTTAQVIPFRNQELLLVNNSGEAFVPMKPVVEGMGLAWQSQHRKLMTGRFASTVTEMVIVAQDGKQREMTCLPLRKLTGWLMSIHPNKVRPELRDGIIAYQNECDDVLWSYWNDGMAVRHDDRNINTLLGQTIGTDGFRCLGAVLDGKVRSLPKPIRTKVKNHIWSQVHKAFSVVSAQDIPADKLDAVRNFIGSYALEGEWIGKDQPAETTLSDKDFAFLYALCADALSVVQTFEEIEPALKLLKSLALMNLPSSVNNFRVTVGRMHDRFGPQMERAAKKHQLYRDYLDMSAARDKSKPIYL